MKTTIKKISGLLFILLGFMPLFFVITFKVRQHSIRQHMKEKLEGRNLQTIILPENEVIWMDDREIWVNEMMFDIRTSKLENGVYTFVGHYDEQETILVKQQRKATGKDQHENKLLSQLIKYFQNIFHDRAPGAHLLVAKQLYVLNLNFIKLPFPFRSIPTPPPQVNV